MIEKGIRLEDIFGMALNLVMNSCKIAIASPPKDLEEEIVREIAKRILQNRYGFSEDQVNDLFSIQKNDQCENTYCESASGKTLNIAISNKPPKRIEVTIGEMVQWILQNKLTIRDVRAEAYTLALSAKNANAGSSCIFRLRRELRNISASPQIIKATKFPDITEEANKIQMNNRKKAETKRIDYPDKFTLESVKERLDAYDIKTLPDYQALADVMVMLCIRPAELRTLRITVAGVTGYAKNRGQPDISRKFRSIEKNQERARELLTWIQRAISSGRIGNPEAVYAVVTNGAKNMATLIQLLGKHFGILVTTILLQYKTTS
ncbi:26496_t:CDS:2, partial [Dentiscutata erythropus]